MANDKKYVSIINNGSQDLYVKDSEARKLISQLSPSSNTVTRSNNTALGSGEIIVGDGTTTVKTSSKTLTTTAPTSSSDDSTVPTSAAVWSAVENGIATNDAMVYKSTIAGGNTGSYGALTPTANKGWTYKVTTAGKINGISVEVGDILICNTDNTSAATSIDYDTIVSNWDFIQTNIDGAVIGPSSSTDAHVATFNGTGGKTIKDSGFTIGKSVPSDAVFTDNNTTYKFTIGSTTKGDVNGTDLGTLKSETATSGGNTLSLCTTGEKYNWDGKQASVAKLGSTTKPVYTSVAGTFAECSTYAGGTAVTLNGSSKAASTATFYAPTTAGTSGYYLKSSGSGAPTWTSFPTIPSITLNGSSSTSPSFYAPTSAGTSGYYLKSNGSGAPTWASFPTIPSKISDVATISAVAITADTSSSCSITGSGNAGKSETIIYTNSSGSDKTVTVPTTYQTPDGAAIELNCPNGGYCEVNYLNVGGTIYARGL